MKPRLTGTLCLAFAICCSGFGASAKDFECPWPTITGGQYSSRVSSLLPSGDAYEDISKLNQAVYALRQSGIGSPLIIDTLISSYCPIVDANQALGADQKTARLASFAARVTRTVYSLESATEIILDVPLAPSVVSAIQAKAQAAKVSPEQWVASIATKAAQTEP